MNMKTQKNIIRSIALASIGLSLCLLTSCSKTGASVLPSHDGIFYAYTLGGTGSDNLDYYINTDDSTALVAQGTSTASSVTVPSTYVLNSVTYNVVGIKDSGFSDDSYLSQITWADESKITKIGYQAFSNSALTSFEIPSGVTTIYASTFYNCRSLAQVTFQAGSLCTSISDHAFAGAVSLSELSYPVGLVSLGAAACQGCVSLPRAVFRTGFTTLGENAFDGATSLGLVFFPSSIASVGQYAFKKCPNAFGYFAGAAPSGYSANGSWNYVKSSSYVPFTANKGAISYGNGYYYVQDSTDTSASDYDIILFLYTGSTKNDTAGSVDLTIPNTISDSDGTHKVVGIDKDTFNGHTELSSAIFQSNMKNIGDNAFDGCNNLSTISFENATSLLTIGNYAFRGTHSGLTSLFFPANITSIGSYAFANSSGLTAVTFEDTTANPSALTSIGSYAFTGTGNFTDTNINGDTNGTLTLPKTLATIGEGAFSGANWVTSIVFTCTSSVSAGASAFYGLKYLKNVTLPETATNYKFYSTCFGLGDTYYYSINYPILHTFYFPSYVTKIGSYIFKNRIYLSAYVYSATSGSWSSNCASTDGFNLGDSVGDDGQIPFYWNVSTTATSGKVLYYHYSDATNGTFDFVGNSTSANTLTCSRFYWEGTNTTTQTPTVPGTISISGTTYTVTAIGNHAFMKNTHNNNNTWVDTTGASLTKVTMPDSIASIGDYAFSGNSMLGEITNGTSYTFPTSLDSLGTNCFVYSGLKKAYLPYVSTISGAVFLGAFDLAVLQIASNGTTSGKNYYTFDNCIYKSSGAANTDATKYSTLFTAADGASVFGNNSSTMTVAWGCTTTADKALRGQRQVKNISFPATLTSIGSYFIDSIGSNYDSSGKTSYNNLLTVRFYTSDTTNYPTSRCTTVDKIAFWGCSKLTTFEIPSSLTTIGNVAFQNCSNLEYFPTSIGGSSTQGLLDLSGTSLSDTSGGLCFSGCSKIQTVILPSSAVKLGGSVFKGCSSITSVTLGSATTTIGDSCFNGNSKLPSITLPSSVTSIGSSSFSGCSALSTVTFADPDTTNTINIYSQAFSGDSKIKSIILPKNVKCLSTQASSSFWGCTGLADSAATSGIFLNMTGAEYTAATSTLPANWNFYKTDTPVKIACHAENTSDRTCARDSQMLYWHYVSGVPTIY